jgi:hypothetical protein
VKEVGLVGVASARGGGKRSLTVGVDLGIYQRGCFGLAVGPG